MNNNKITFQREAWIDWAKAYLIYLVVVGHTSIPHNSGLWTYIYSFHMPAFFILSGYLYKPHHWRDTLKSLLTPVAFCSVINFLLYGIIAYFRKGSVDLHYMINNCWLPYFEYKPESVTLFIGFWFIVALLVSRLLLGDIERLTFIRRNYKVIFLILVAFMQLEPLLNIPSSITNLHLYKVLPSLPFMMIGIWLKEKNITSFIRKEKQKIILVSLLFFVSIGLQIGYINMWESAYGTMGFITFVINALASSILLFSTVAKFPKWNIAITFSNGTFLVLGLHYYLLFPLHTLFNSIGFNNIFRPWLMGVVILLILYCPIKLIETYCPILLGKANKK